MQQTTQPAQEDEEKMDEEERQKERERREKEKQKELRGVKLELSSDSVNRQDHRPAHRAFRQRLDAHG